MERAYAAPVPLETRRAKFCITCYRVWVWSQNPQKPVNDDKESETGTPALAESGGLVRHGNSTDVQEL